MQSKLRVSVCMITYKHEKFINKAIHGVLMQQGEFDVELIIADDNSPDRTSEIVSGLKETHKNGHWINYTKHKTNKGMMPNFSWALSQCKGDYIALCDGDDYWTDELKLKKQITFLEKNTDYILSFHPCSFLENNDTLIEQRLESMQYDISVKNLLANISIPSASIVFKNNKILNDLPSWFQDIASGDVALLILLFEQGKFKLLPENMSVYRLHNAGVSELHKGTRMIHFRASLFSKLNEHFNYKYELEIYEALHELMIKYMPQLSYKPKELTTKDMLSKLKHKVIKKIK